MVKKLHFLFIAFFCLLGFGTHCYGQKKLVYLSEALSINLNSYNKKVDSALALHDDVTAKSLFDSLVKNHLNGTTIDPLYFEGYRTRMASTLDFDKPTLLLTYSSWCIPNAGEIPVLNEMASRYSNRFNFVVLFFDHREIVRKKARQFNRNIEVVYVDDTTNRYMFTQKLLKQALGLSLSLMISESGEILDIHRRPSNQFGLSEQDQLAINFSLLSQQIASVD